MSNTTITEFLFGVLAGIVAGLIVEAIEYLLNRNNKNDRQG